MSLKRKKKLTSKKMQKGSIGNFFVFGVVALLMVLGVMAVGGLPSQDSPTTGQEVEVITPTPGAAYSNLQLKTFGYITIAPTPPPPQGSICTSPVNSEPTIILAIQPAAGQTVSATGQIIVWVNDEGAPFVAPGEEVNPTTGAITTVGDRAAKAADGYLDEPALYIAPATVEAGGQPHFPDFIKGQFNNTGLLGNVTNGPAYDPLPPGSPQPGGPNPNGFGFNQYVAEYIWNVANLGLTTGSYGAEFLIHDGDRDRAAGCVTITIQ